MAQADDDPLAALLAEISLGPGSACRVAIAEHRITEWRDGPQAMPAFETVEEIMGEVDPVEQIIDGGCDATFVWLVLACSDPDEPQVPHIVPRGVKVDSEADFARLLDACFAQVAADGFTP